MSARLDDEGVTAVVATIVMLLVVIVVSGSVFVLVMDLRQQAREPAPHIALLTDDKGSTGNQWRLSLTQSVPAREMGEFLIILRTPQHGTLVADISKHPAGHQVDHYWPLGPDSDGLRHTGGFEPGEPGTGGFHLRILDIGGDGRLGGGDRIFIWYDADGDHGHMDGPDDAWPSGAYTFELKHQRSDRFIAYEIRHF